jgi:hypothetical protein
MAKTGEAPRFRRKMAIGAVFCLNGMQEVEGSSPLGSTILPEVRVQRIHFPPTLLCARAPAMLRRDG